MSILGTLVDKTTVSRAGDAGTTNGTSLALTTLAHSLPATNPEAVFVNLRSIEAIGPLNGVVEPFVLGGNASLLTLGYKYGSQVSAPTMMFDVISTVYHSVIR